MDKGEIIFKDFIKHPFDENNGETQTAQSGWMCRRSPDRLLLSFCRQDTGLNRHSQKRWYRWVTPQRVGLYRSSVHANYVYAKMMNIKRSGGKSVVHWHTYPLQFVRNAVAFDTHQNTVEEWLGYSPTLEKAMPLLDANAAQYIQRRPQFWSRYGAPLQAKNYVELSLMLFPSHTTHPLMDAIEGNSLGLVILASQLRGLVPIYKLVEFLEINRTTDAVDPPPPAWRKQFVNEFTQEQLLSLTDQRMYMNLLNNPMKRLTTQGMGASVTWKDLAEVRFN